VTLILAYQSRGITRDFTIKDADGNAITPAADDKVRVTIGREGEIAKLTVISGTSTDNGSSVTKGETSRVRLDASDLALIDPGVYTFQFDLYDASDTEEWKCIDRQVIVVRET